MNQRGQTIPLVILLAVLGLVLGLAMTGRQVSRVEETKETEDYNRAFSAAEAGLEDAALKIKDNPALLQQNFGSSGTQTLSDSQATYEYTCQPVDGLSSVDLEPIARDDVGQVNLVNGAGAHTTGNLNIYWVKGTKEQTSPASLVIALITQGGVHEGCVDNYCIYKYAVNPVANPRSNGFATASPSSNSDYTSQYTLSIPGGEQAQLLRIRAMYNTDAPTSVRVESTSQLGFQYQECIATGISGDNQAKSKFTISFPTLPALFDYVLFSSSTITHQ